MYFLHSFLFRDVRVNSEKNILNSSVEWSGVCGVEYSRVECVEWSTVEWSVWSGVEWFF